MSSWQQEPKDEDIIELLPRDNYWLKFISSTKKFDQWISSHIAADLGKKATTVKET